MKKLYIGMAAALLVPALLAGCKKVLDQPDPQNLSRDNVFNDSTLTKFNLDYIYAQNQPAWFGNGSQSYIGTLGPLNLTEECYSDNALVKGTITLETVGDIATSNSTSSNYAKLRLINNFITNVTAGSIADGTKARFVAQAKFWRAFRYFELVKLYGGVPVTTVALDAVGQEALAETFLPRSTTAATYKQIIDDLNSAIAVLPVKWPQTFDYGRITKGAAQAFLGRVLLTYASPQFNSPIASLPATPTTVLATTDPARWQAAYDASTAAIATLSANGFGLYNKFDQTLWTTETNNPEAVLVTQYNTDQTDNGRMSNGYPGGALPKSISTSGGSNLPTWDMVLAFPMADGKPVGSSTKYTFTTNTFYANRDPRFYQTIAYNGCAWPVPGNASYRLWTYYYYSNTAGTQTKTTEPVAASNTGFYLRKGVDPNISVANLPFAGTDWQEIRYAEVLLNQAEAAAELNKTGQSDVAYQNLIAIRKRAGIEAGADGLYGLTAGMNREQLVNAVMYERQIEFAYEGKRYWDLRRRKLLEVTLNGKRRTGVTILLKNTGNGTDYILANRDASASSGAAFDTYYANNFTITTKQLDTYNIAYQAAGYFFGIPTNALRNNPQLLQSTTWGGPFDPLQ